MHDHECRYCEENFICPEDAAECFRKYIVCRECFWTIEFKYFLLVFFLGVVAIGLTLFLFENVKKTGAGSDDRAGLLIAKYGIACAVNSRNTTQGEYNNVESAAT